MGNMLTLLLLMLWTVIAGVSSSVAENQNSAGLKFLKEPPYRVDFSNNKEVTVECAAEGNPPPTVNWTLADGTAVSNIQGLREISPNGNLVFKSFKPESFRLDVHLNVYRCVASNSAGIIHSRDVIVHGVVLQAYEIQVYDTYVIEKNTAVFKCNVPPVLRNHFKVVAWIKNENQLIEPANSESPDSKYAVMPTGELHVHDPSLEESGSKYKCKTINTLTGETQSSSNAGQLFVTESLGIVHPKILDSASAIVAPVGQKAILPCVAQGNPMPTVKWYKKGAANQTITLKTGDRFSLTKSALYIHDVENDDKATYICEVFSEVGKQQLAISLRIVAPLSAVIQPAIHEAKNKEKVTFSCEIHGQPINSVIWRHNGTPIKTAVGNILVIDSVDASSQGIYQCFASNDVEMIQAIAELHLSEILPHFAETFNEVTTKPGSSVAIKCQASGVPNPTITWAIDEIPIENSSRLQVTSETDRNGRVVSNVKIENTVVSDGGIYSCTAENKAGKSVHMARINVYGEIGIRTVKEKIAVAGTTLYLNCPYYGYPVQEIGWEKDGITLPSSFGQSQLQNGTLVAEDIIKSVDAGEYKCFAKNSDGRIAEGKLDVAILVPPKVIPFAFLDDQFYKGMRAHVTCAISQGDLPVTFKWLKDGAPLSQELGALSRQFDEQTDSLSIENVSSRHSGNYTCIVQNKAGRAAHTTQLLVRVAPKIIPFEFRGLLHEGSPARVVCGLQEGDTPVQLSWLHDGVPVIASVSRSFYEVDGMSSILSILSLSADHTGVYSCVAKNRAGMARHDAVLRVNVPPKIVPFAFQEESLVQGVLARVSCVVSRGDLPLKLHWEKDGVEIASGALGVRIKSFDDHSSILSIPSVSPLHNGKYTCVASNDAGTDRHSANLVVQVPPRWITQPKDASVLKESSIMLNCQVDGFPKPKLVWKQGNDAKQSGLAKLVVNTDNIQLYPNGSLFIKSVKSINEGFYFCLASNGIGRGLSARVQLKINAPPFFKHLVHKQSVAVGGDTQLQCLVQGDTPISIAWYKSEKVIEDGQARHKIETTNTASDALSLLTIHKVERQDNRRYQCTAQNEFGVNNAFIELTVLEPPDAPLDIKSTSVGSQTVEFVWTSSYSGNEPVKRYIIQYKKEGESWDAATTMETANGEPTNSIVTKLQSATNYLFRVFAENTQGRSLASQILRITTTEDVPNGPPRNVSVEPVNTETFRVMWKAPEEKNWNGKLLGYYIGYKEVDTNDPLLYKTLLTHEPTSDAMFVQIGGLKQFKKYAVVVQAYNNKGKGPESDTVIVMTSEGAPSLPPVDVHCTTLTSQSIHVTWTEPPTDSINGILSGYKVLYKPASDWFDDVAENFNITLQTPMTLNHLEKFSNYSIQVLAMTKAGEGPKSITIFCKTQDDAPGQPEDIKAIAMTDDSVIVAWKPPQNPNGVIQSYSVYWRDTGNVKDMSAHTITAHLNHYEVTRLKKGHRYEFWVKASTLAGEGQSSKTVFQIPNGPTVPAKIVSFEKKLITPWKVDITLPCHSVGIPEPTKTWILKENRLQNGDQYKIAADGTLTVKRLREEDAGDYICSIRNEFGEDKITYAIIILAPPTAPKMEVKSTSSNSIELQWNVPASKMSRIKGYTINIRKDVGDWTEITVGSEARTYQITNLNCGTRYEIFMQAFNKIGIGAPSDVFMVSTNGSVPSAPSKGDLIEESSNSISLYLNSWKSNGCPILYFMVEYAPKSSYEWTLVSSNAKPEDRRLLISSMKPATWFALRMTAHNSAGSSITNYDFATLTLSGATITPELQGDAPNQKIDGLMATLNFYIIVPIACTTIILLAIFAMACMCVKMKKREEAKKGNRMSVVSSELKRTDSSESFSYMQRGTLNRQTNEDSIYGDVEIAPYATLPFHHHMQLMATLQRRQQQHGPPLPTGFEGFSSDSMPMMHQPFFPPDSCFIPGPEHTETTFVFPNPPSETMLQNMDSFPSYQNEQSQPPQQQQQQAELMESKATFI